MYETNTQRPFPGDYLNIEWFHIDWIFLIMSNHGWCNVPIATYVFIVLNIHPTTWQRLSMNQLLTMYFYYIRSYIHNNVVLQWPFVKMSRTRMNQLSLDLLRISWEFTIYSCFKHVLWHTIPEFKWPTWKVRWMNEYVCLHCWMSHLTICLSASTWIYCCTIT